MGVLDFRKGQVKNRPKTRNLFHFLGLRGVEQFFQFVLEW